ncbi:hypothetical protein ACTWP5_21990 [Streptomyces sp. 4N509B]|uniref:hypothetical protein n=1 Tax=Streptomyces sp. 4N509B TaxID=3457413 RepID=UPI003FD6704D
MIPLRDRQFRAPVFLDVVVWNYEHTPNVTSPRDVGDANLEVLREAVLENTRKRYGTGETSFDPLLTP